MKRAALFIIAAALLVFHGSAPAQPPAVTAASAGLRCGETDDPTPTPVTATPTASATATEPAWPTWTPNPSETRPAPSLTPSPSPTRCTRQPVEVVLVIDASTSMLRFTSAGRSKLDAALDAAAEFIGFLDFDAGDATAIVAFNDETWTQLMTGSEAVALAALGRIPLRVQEGTRLDLALEAGGIAAATGRPGARKVVILLTDGLPNRVPFGIGTEYPRCLNQECSVLEEARLLKVLGIEIHAIGLGDVLERLMVLIPNDPADYHYAPDGEDLAAIYREIAAGLLDCGGGFLSKRSRLVFPATQTNEKTLPNSLAWTVESVPAGDDQPGERILVGGSRLPTSDELEAVAHWNRGHVVEDPLLERAGYRVVWTPGRDNEQLHWRSTIDLQGSGVSAWREEMGELVGPAGDPASTIERSSHTKARLSQNKAGNAWPNDTFFSDQWALRGIWGMRWADAWIQFKALGSLAHDRIIAIIDNGLECAHADLACWVGTHFNATQARELEHRSPADTEVLVRGFGYDHGTFVAGIAGAHTNNGYGIAGISEAAVLDTQGCIGGGCAETDVIRAMQWIEEEADAGLPVQAVNMSFAFKTSRLCQPIEDLRLRGIMPFAAVGNSGDRTTGSRPQYPAACSDSVGVVHTQEDGSPDPQGQRAAVDLAAPGSEVRSLCARPHTTGVGSGSSFASPAGAAAYVVVRAALEPAVGPQRAAEEALDVLYQTADPIEPASHARGVPDPSRDGYGRINLEAALAEVEGSWSVALIPTPTPFGTPAFTPTPTPCTDTPERCAAIGTATALARGTSTPTPPAATPTIDPTVAAHLTAAAVSSPTPVPSETPVIDPTVAAILTAQHTPPTPNPTEVSKILTQMAPTPTPNKAATAMWLRCHVFKECPGLIYIPGLLR